MEQLRIRWFQWAAPQSFYPLADRLWPWFAGLAAALALVGLYMGFFIAPTDFQQGDARSMFNFQKQHSPLRRGLDIDDVGGAGLYLLSDLSGGVTGEIHFVDGGYNIISMPRPEDLRVETARGEAAE